MTSTAIVSLSIAAVIFLAGVALCAVAMAQFARADLTSEAERRAIAQTNWWAADDRHRRMPRGTELTEEGRRRRRHAFRCLGVAALCFVSSLLMLGLTY